MHFIQHRSTIDESVNFVADIDAKQKLECRYVKRRDSDYFIVYISSQTGCAQACRMCHLTATGQNVTRDATVEEMLQQADVVLKYFENHHEDQKWRVKPRKVHFNFMARGEPLACEPLIERAPVLFEGLRQRADKLGLDYEFLVSTIVPKVFAESRTETGLVEAFSGFQAKLPALYYSLYSLDPAVRKKWLPRAADPAVALPMLKRYQDAGGLVKIHFALIEGVNDDIHSIDQMANQLIDYGLACDFNIVRYNPYDGRYGQESEETTIEALKDRIEQLLANAVKVVPKVGFDVKASCGMFVK